MRTPPHVSTRVAVRPAQAATGVLLVAVVCVVYAGWLWAPRDTLGDVSTELGSLPWAGVATLLVFLPLIAAVHYVAAAVALRGVSGGRLPLREATHAQLAAAATNRVIPVGVGGASVNMHYLIRTGLAPGAASTAMGALAVMGGLTDAAYVAAVTGLGGYVGLPGARRQLAALAGAGTSGGAGRTWLLAAALATAVGVVLFRLRGRVVAAARAAVNDGVSHLYALARHPGRLLTTAAASMVTTAVLSVGFVVAVRMWAHAAVPAHAGALIAVYWVAVAAGGAVPLPAFFGVTEAALIAGLTLTGYTASSATIAVLLFRLVTYWLALPVGVWSGRRLRRVRLL